MSKYYLTEERHQELEEELRRLKNDGRQSVALRLKHAKELGDLSENSEYQEAREEQARLERRIAEVADLLRNATIIKRPSSTDTVVSIGSRVTVRKNGELITYTIVGSHEARPADGFISNESPIGKALLGKRAEEQTIVQTPRGKTTYEIVSVA